MGVLACILFASTAMAQQVKVTIGLPGTADLHRPEMIEIFKEQNPDLDVEEQVFAWGDFFQKLPAMLATGTAPDVWYGEAGRALGWRHEGVTADLTPFVERDLDLNDYFFLHAAVDPRTGEWTGIPSDFQVTALYYNTNHLPARGVPFPSDTWTTDDLVEAAQRLTIPGPECPVQYGFHLNQTYITAGWMLWPRLFGAPILSADRTESRLNDPATIEAFDYMRSLIHDFDITPKPGGCGGYSFRNGGISMHFDVYTGIRLLRNAGLDSYDVAMIPTSPEGNRFTTAVPNVWVINNAASPEAKEAAWRWIKFQIGEEAQLIRMSGGSGVLVNRNVSPSFLADPGPPASREVFLQSYAFADTLEENAVWTEYRTALASALSPLWQGRVTAQEALLNAHQIVSAILSSVYE